MKKILGIIIVCSMIMTNIYADGLSNDPGTNPGDGNGNGINMGDAVTLNRTGDGIKINVGGTAATSGTKFRTTAYEVTVNTPSGTSVVTIDVNDGGATGPTINHAIDLHSNSTGTSINDLLIKAGEPSITDSLVNGEVTLVFDAKIEVYDGATGNVLGTYDKDTLGDPNADLQIPGTLFGDYTWGTNTVMELDDYFGRNIPLPKIDDPNDPANPSGGGSITANPIATTITEPTPIAKIDADAKGSELFDVTQGIPSGESIYGDITAGAYKLNYGVTQYTGNYQFTVTVNATITYNYTVQDRDPVTNVLLWEDAFKTIPKMVSTTQALPYSDSYNVTKPFSYYSVSEFGLYSLSAVNMVNGSVGAIPIPSPIAPTVTLNQYLKNTDRFSYNDSVNIGSIGVIGTPGSAVDLSAHADVDLYVKNDFLTFDGTTLMYDTLTKNNTPSPTTTVTIPSTLSGELYSSGNVISSSQANGIYVSTTQLMYTLTGTSVGSIPAAYVVNVPTNEVIVHTPVVNYSSTLDMTFDDQMVNPSSASPTVIIDKSFIVDYPNSGMHKAITGYGDQDYSRYIGSKQIRFDFGVYEGVDRTGTYIEPNTWHDLSTSDTSYTFFIPHWIDDGIYNVNYRTIAVNGTSSDGSGANANILRGNTIASNGQQLVVAGQIYDFKVHSSTSRNWETFYFDASGNHTNKYFESGINEKDGRLSLPHPNYVLPIMPGKNDELGYQNKAVLKGEQIYFSVKTNGSMDSDKDFVIIEPEYAYVDSLTGIRQNVDIYVNEGNKLIPIQDSTDSITMSLNNRFTSIEESVLENTATSYVLRGVTTMTMADYRLKYMWDLSKAQENIGSLEYLALDQDQRIFIGEHNGLPTGVTDLEAVTGQQQYYGTFFIPSNTLVVPQGTSLEDIESSSINDGFLIINFKIRAIDEYSGNPTDYYLSYDEKQCNMWSIEGYDLSQADLEYGDIVLVDLSKKINDEYTTDGTH